MEIKDWFEEQIELRKKKDIAYFNEAFADLASVVRGEEALSRMMLGDLEKTVKTVEQILLFYHIRPGRMEVKSKDLNEQMEELLRPLGVMRRDVQLKDGWYRQTVGAMLGFTKEGEAAALLPKKYGYVYFDYEAGKWKKITKKNCHIFSDKAVCFYRPFPVEPVGARGFFKFCIRCLDVGDYARLFLAFLSVSAAGLAAPFITEKIFNEILPENNQMMLIAAAAVLACTSAAGTLFAVLRSLLLGRSGVKLGIALDAAVMARLISLPAEFFKGYNAGELTRRVDSVSEAVKNLMHVAVQLLLAMLCSGIYLFQIRVITPMLLAPSVFLIGAVFIISLLSTSYQVRLNKRRLYTRSKTAGMEYALYSGVQKLKLAGAERRAFGNWAKVYRENALATYQPPFLLKIVPSLTAFCIYAGWALVFVAAARAGVGQAEFMAFSSAYLLMMGAFLNCSEETGTIAEMLASLEMIKPVLNEVPEASGHKEMVQKINGGVELSHVSFRYAKRGPYIIDDLSMKIRAGQYIGIVGKTGCGKSTLLRLLLGFEQPGKGAVYYDRKDLRRLDAMSLRQKIGSVLQDGFLFDGDILSNITIAAPWLGIEAAWEAAEMAGLKEDIEELPMGMFTMVSEGAGSISGGQKQRIMIARAIVSKPKILMFDEATSALDNETQKRVTESLGKMKCTRIVIAHRLSTIKDCDKIFVMDGGRIAEEGKYEQLMKKEGLFAELVRRQQIQ